MIHINISVLNEQDKILMEQQPDKKKYDKFIDSLNLIDEFITEFSWKRHVDTVDHEKKLKLDITLKNIKPKYLGNSFVTGNTLKLKGLDSDKNLHFEINITLNLHIKTESEIDKDCVDFYSKNTVQITTVPAFRTLVKEALIKMGFPPFTLPFLKRKSSDKK